MRVSRWPRGTCTAPGRRPSSYSCCSRTSMTKASYPLFTMSWTSRGSTSFTCSLICRRSSAPEGMRTENSLKEDWNYFIKCSEQIRPENRQRTGAVEQANGRENRLWQGRREAIVHRTWPTEDAARGRFAGPAPADEREGLGGVWRAKPSKRRSSPIRGSIHDLDTIAAEGRPFRYGVRAPRTLSDEASNSPIGSGPHF